MLKLLLLINISLLVFDCGKPINNNSSKTPKTNLAAYETSLKGNTLTELETEKIKLDKEYATKSHKDPSRKIIEKKLEILNKQKDKAILKQTTQNLKSNSTDNKEVLET
ncbi:MAG: hypothetical protein GY830_06810 [Bacteroidetes bacterium]|nr:hypothetical protein [Bacteroidota bacterium]